MEYINKNLVFEIVKGVLNLLIEEDKVKSLLPKISDDAPKIYEGFMSNLSDLYKFANNEYKDKIVNVVLDNIALDNLIGVKEVNLEKELDSMITPELKLHKALPSLFDVAKHFFELGLQANNTLTWEDIEIIGKLRLDVALEYRNKELCSKSEFPIEDYCKEVLKRFNAQKGE